MPHIRAKIVGSQIRVTGILAAPASLEASRQAQGLPPIVPVTYEGILDTGASHTVFQKSLLDSVGLIQTGERRIATPSSGSGHVMAAQYYVRLAFGCEGAVSVMNFPEIDVCASDMGAMGAPALIGMDVLSYFILHLDGPNNSVTLSY